MNTIMQKFYGDRDKLWLVPSMRNIYSGITDEL